MKIVLVHNRYQQPGGEDAVFAAEANLLRHNGHEVVECVDDNWRIKKMNSLNVAAQTVWSRPARHRLSKLIQDNRPDVVHFHNTFPLISPSAYYVSRKLGVPVVQTLHNYRLLCPAAVFFRDGQRCEECLSKTLPWPGVLHACYRKSRLQTAVVAAMLTVHRGLKTWHKQVDIYIALTEFARRKFIEGGLPAEKILVKTNFLHPDPGSRNSHGEYALFVGRLSVEKGMITLLKAWLSLRHIPLKVVGDGPLAAEVYALVNREGLENVELLGQRSHEEVLALMKGSRFLIFSSEWYEGCPMTLVEALACGVPIVASRLGAMAEIVEENHTGLLFRPRDFRDLAEKVRWAIDHTDSMVRMGENARRQYEEKYSPQKNYQMLLNIYDRAIRCAATS